MEKAKVFMIMPFQEDFFEAYEMLKERFIDKFEFSHAGDDVSTQQNILKDIVQMIYDADVIIADLTDLNSNVFYELGIAHAFNKKVISITKNIGQLPFDIRSYRATEYSVHFRQFDNLIKELDKYLNGAIDGTVNFGNPVSDFLSTIKGTTVVKSQTKVDEAISESGFIDFMADIDEKIELFTGTIKQMTIDLISMTGDINKGTSEIERVKRTGGTGTASFVRKVTQKVADSISVFDSKVKEHNEVYLRLWPEIEANCLGLIESKYIDTPENKEGLVTFLKSLNAMKNAALTTSRQTEGMLSNFTALRGMQRSLNQSITSLEIDIKKFIEFSVQMGASIDRIIGKSKFVVGEIDFTGTEQLS